jgi:hypothetical protein
MLVSVWVLLSVSEFVCCVRVPLCVYEEGMSVQALTRMLARPKQTQTDCGRGGVQHRHGWLRGKPDGPFLQGANIGHHLPAPGELRRATLRSR